MRKGKILRQLNNFKIYKDNFVWKTTKLLAVAQSQELLFSYKSF